MGTSSDCHRADACVGAASNGCSAVRAGANDCVVAAVNFSCWPNHDVVIPLDLEWGKVEDGSNNQSSGYSGDHTDDDLHG
jgi:hypothetical protein